ncbi:hypothetical protein [Methanobrevibacter sp.]
MNDKKLYLVLLSFIICILSISAINATENTASDDVISADNNKEINVETINQYDDVSTSIKNSELNEEENYNNDKVSESETDKITESNDDPQSFTDLNTAINGNTNSTIYLSNNYQYDDDTDDEYKNGIYIDRNLTIYGNGITIDGDDSARIFKVDDKVTVAFHNITFVNGKTDEHGGAIYGGNAYDCTFTDNEAERFGGAMAYGDAYNCTFISNKAGQGGAMYESNAYGCTFTENQAAQGGAKWGGETYNCVFQKNEADGYGGAIAYGVAYNCEFSENEAENGGAIYDADAYNSTFTSNIASDNGGAIHKGNAYNCTFTDNNGDYGGAIDHGHAYNSTFNENYAHTNGGAICNGSAVNCTFTENKAVYWGGAMCHSDSYNCTFISNKADNKGSAMYDGNTCLCRLIDNANSNTGFIPLILDVSEYKSTYMSGERLKIQLTGGDVVFDGLNTTINIYKGDELITTVYGLTTEGWVVDLEPGVYTAALCITDFPDDVSATTTIDVSKLGSKIIASPIITIYNVGKYFVITLTNQNGKPIKNASLTVSLGDAKKYTTNGKGQVKINIATLTPKTYNVKIRYGGSDIINPSTASTKVTVKKATPKITAKSTSYKLKVKTKKYTAIFKDNKNKALKNTKVTLKVNGKTYTVKTNSKGQATFKITNLKRKGIYKAVITVPTNTYYNKVSKNVKISVKQ